MVKYFLNSEFIRALSALIGVSGSSLLCLLTFLMLCVVVVCLVLFYKENVRHKWGVIAVVCFFALVVIGSVVVFSSKPAQATQAASQVPPPAKPQPTDAAPSKKSDEAKPTSSSQSPSGSKHRLPTPQKQVAPPAEPTQTVPLQTAPSVPSCVVVNGICVQGGTVTNPTVNNYGPPPPQIYATAERIQVKRPAPGAEIYLQKNLPVPPPTDVIQVNVIVKMLNTFSNPSFIFKCNKPCFRNSIWMNETSFADHQSGRGLDLIIDIEEPRVLRQGSEVTFGIQAEDGSDPGITSVQPNY